MKKSQLLFLGAVLIILAGLYFYQQHPATIDQEEIYTQLCPDVQLDDIDEIEVWTGTTEKAAPLHLKKREQAWWVELNEQGTTFSAPAKPERLKRLVGHLNSLHGEKRAEGAAILDTFYLKDDQAMHLVLKENDKEKLHLLVGKRGPEWDSCFVRKNKADTVYLASNNLLGLFDIWSEEPKQDPEARPWVDLMIISQGPSEVEGLSYARGTTEWSLVQGKQGDSEKEKRAEPASGKPEKTEAEWVLTLNGQEQIKGSEEIRKFLSGLFPLRAVDVAPPEKAQDAGLGPGDQYGRLTVHLKGKGIKILHIGRLDKETSKGWIRDQRGVLFQVEGKILDTINNPIVPH